MEKKEFQIDWESVMEDDDSDRKDDKVPELVIVNTKTLSSEDQTDCYKSLDDRALDELLERNKQHLVQYGPGLPDKGDKIRFRIANLQAEKHRRLLLQPSKMDVDESSKPVHSRNSGVDVRAQGNAAARDTSRQENTNSKEVSRSTFVSSFTKPKTEIQSTKAFGKELEDLGCESGKNKVDKKTVTSPNSGWRILKAEHGEKQLHTVLKGNQKSKDSYGKKKLKESSSYSLVDDDDESIGHKTREWSWQESTSHSSRRRKIC